MKRFVTCAICLTRPVGIMSTVQQKQTKVIQRRCTHDTRQNQASLSADKEEVAKFTHLADKWWDRSGEFSLLHTMNNLRIPYIISNSPPAVKNTKPLAGLDILDVGCGGGILSKPLARLGANVTGLDATRSSIDAAQVKHDSLREAILDENLSYVCSTVEDHATDKQEVYDVVVMSEVVEHVSNLDSFLHACSSMTKPGGSLIVTTVNRTRVSYWLAVFAAETLLHLVPRGTHDWEKFVTPEELQGKLEKNGSTMTSLHGMAVNPVTGSWCWSSNTLMNYACAFTKQPR